MITNTAMKDNTIYNCHTHIFTIDHVPNKFGKKLIPVFYHLITMRFIKWYYETFTSRGNRKYKQFIHKVKKIKYGFISFLKWTVVLQLLNILIFFVIKWLFQVFANLIRIDFLFSKAAKETFSRFKAMGRHSLYKKQDKLFDLLAKSYQPGTKFVVLSMDMDYMKAGKPIVPYLEQLEDLKRIKSNHRDTIFPFLFLDPRRIKETKEQKGFKNYESYSQHLLSKSYFNGIKLYPALGYYPFDKEWISSFKFVEENEIPIISHCIEGTVFYRGKKQESWNSHPILKYNKKNKEMLPIPLPQSDNYDFTKNFTHPLNYHCLMNKDLLKEYLGEEVDLKNLKICLAHFGGSDEWNRYLNDSWNNYNKNISHEPIEEYIKKTNTLNHKNPRTIWWNASWLSIIYDLMITYPNFYTDISFILYNDEFFPLLKFMLQDEKVKNKILFGTDYYLVSQKNTESVLFQKLRGYLGEELFHLISNENPRRFLSTKWQRF